MRETNKYLRRKTKQETQRSEKSTKPKIVKKKIKYPKQILQRLVDGHDDVDFD